MTYFRRKEQIEPFDERVKKLYVHLKTCEVFIVYLLNFTEETIKLLEIMYNDFDTKLHKSIWFKLQNITEEDLALL